MGGISPPPSPDPKKWGGTLDLPTLQITNFGGGGKESLAEHVGMRRNEALEYLKIMNFTLISFSQSNEFCDFLAHRNERYSLAYPPPPLLPNARGNFATVTLT